MGKYDQYRQGSGEGFKYADTVQEFKNSQKGLIGTAANQIKEVGGQVVQGVKNIPKEDGFLRKTWGDFKDRADNIEKNNATLQMGDRKTIRNSGQLLGAANDLFGNVVSSAAKTFIPKSVRKSAGDVGTLALETKPGQAIKETAVQAFEQWKKFEKSNPELAKDIAAVGNIASFALNFAGGSGASKIKPTQLLDDAVGKARGVVETTAGKVTPAIKTAVSKIPGEKIATGAGEVGISAATGLSREAQQIIKTKPSLYQQARQGTITREAVTDDVVGALGKRMDDISDLGKGYENIRTSSVKVPKKEIGDIAVKHLDEMKVSKIDLPLGDRATVQKAIDYISEYPDVLSAQNALSLRRKFDDLINWKSEATGEGKRIIRGMRAKIDDYLGNKLPGLKDLDKKYGPEREFIDKVRGMVLDKQGNLKDNAISTVANIVGKGKEMKLDRLEKLLPGIGDKVRALKAFEEIQNLGQIKTGAVTRQLFSFAVGGIPGFVATNPYVVGFALEKYGFAKAAIKKILSKGKKITDVEAKAVQRAIKSLPKKKALEIISAEKGTSLLPTVKP